MPPHRGHLFAVEFARQRVERLVVLVCSIEREPIPGALRYTWMKGLCPGCEVVHLTEELPQEPAESPDFWPLWTAAIRRILPEGPDLVFASEEYGAELAKVLGATFAPVDIARQNVPISATAIRQDPIKHWEFIPPPVRPYFVRRVCIFGPESTGKTNLARDLAEHFGTEWVPEYARELLDSKGGKCDVDDIPLIARGQVALEDAKAQTSTGLLICDTDTLTTTIWSVELFGDCPSWIYDLAEDRPYDLTLLLEVDVPWVDDDQRFLQHRRKEFFRLCRATLEDSGRRFVVISGNWPERFARAKVAIEEMLADGPRSGGGF